MGVVKTLAKAKANAKDRAKKVAGKAGDKVAKLSSLSPSQLEEIANKRAVYLQYSTPDDPAEIEVAERLLAASSIKIYNAHLPQISELYLPANKYSEESKKSFNPMYNIRYINITKWVSDKEENSLEKLINVYGVLSDEQVNIALIFNRTTTTTNVYLAVSNAVDKDNNKDVDSYIKRLQEAIKGNFPGAEWDNTVGKGNLPFFKDNTSYSISSVSNIPTEKSEKFKSQTIEKLLDGTVPDSISKEYTLILLATPINDIDERKNILSELYSGLMPYSSWQTSYTFTESDATGSMAIFGVNAGVSAGLQNTISTSQAQTEGETKSSAQQQGQNVSNQEMTNEQITQSENESTQLSRNRSTSQSTSNSYNDMQNWGNSQSEGTTQTLTEGSITSEGNSITGTAGVSLTETGGVDFIGEAEVSASESFSVATSNFESTSASTAVSDAVSSMSSSSYGYSVGRGLVDTQGTSVGESVARSVGTSLAKSAGKSVGTTIGRSIASTLGKAVNTALTVTEGVAKGTSLGANFGANFARSSNVTVSVGKNEGITQSFTNYNIKHALEVLESQMKRFDQSSALGMWDFAAYVISEDVDVSRNVAHTYLSLTQGEESYLSGCSINTWRGDLADDNDTLGESETAKVICNYIKELKHPIFFLNPEVTDLLNHYYVYPPVVTPTTGLTGKELSYSLNFPTRSVPGFPVLQCAEFGRNIVTYDNFNTSENNICIGKIFHMNHVEPVPVSLNVDSLSSHVFITGSTGSGKSNTVYKMLHEAKESGIKYLVIEPAKGEYKNIFGNEANVYGTNPQIMPLLRINPFSFPNGIHVLEHIDRIIEIFNVCWPMYAAMPAVLKNAVEKSYEDCGWDLVSSTNDYCNDLYPSFSDVARNVKSIVESSEYDNENKGAYKGALLTRLQSLCNGINGLIFNQDEIQYSDLFDNNVVIDLSRVGSSETKSLIMGMLVLKLQEYRLVTSDGMNSSLKHITVLEEAHNILKRTSTTQSVEGSNLIGKSVEMIANAIAEMRTYGEGFIIADQAPGLMDMSVIRNTNTKIIMRLPDLSDRELVGKAANLNDDQIAELSKLPRGVAALYQNEWVQPVLCKIEQYHPESDRYQFNPNVEYEDETSNSKTRIEIAEMLSNGVSLDKEIITRDIRPKLDSFKIDSSVQVTIFEMLTNPPIEPRMTRLAPVMNALFPEVNRRIKRIVLENKSEKAWTEHALKILEDKYPGSIPSQVRKDIIQGIMTYHLLYELNDISRLKDWSQRGGLA